MAPADRRNQGSHKTKGDDMQKTFNKFLLVGDVTLGPDNRAKVECSEIGPNRVYTENLVIVGDDTTEIKAGRGKIEGRLQTAFTKDGRPRTIMACTRFKKIKKDTLSVNVQRLIGTMHQSFDLLDSNPGKRTMGWGLVRIEDEIFRFVAFSGLAHRLDKGNSKMPPAKKGAEIQVQGRLRIREYENNGEIQKMTEVVCDPDWTLVTKPAEIVDVFADDADAQAFDDDAGDAEASDAI
jgi:hypothetical protein